MNVRQLRALREILRHGLHMSAAAEALHASQSTVSKQIRELEAELGTTIFVRRRNRVIGISDAGRALISIAERIVRDVDMMHVVAADYSSKGLSGLTVATTLTHARHTLPGFVSRFAQKHRGIPLQLRAGTPAQCCRLVADGAADIAISTEPDEIVRELVVMPAYRLARGIVAPAGHPLLARRRIDLKLIAKHPLITYDETFSSRRLINRIFEKSGLHPTIALRAIDPEICKTYVALGMGVAILPQIAYDAAVDGRTMGMRDVGNLFDHGVVNVYVRRGGYLRSLVYDFIALFAPHLSRQAVDAAVQAAPDHVSPAHVDLPLARRAHAEFQPV